jgi:hypothetical protein
MLTVYANNDSMSNNKKSVSAQNAINAIEVIKTAYSIAAASGKVGIPSGHLYARLMENFTSLEQYESMVALMVKTKLLSRGDNHLLIAAHAQ